MKPTSRFTPASSDRPWRFEAFCKDSSGKWGKRLAAAFSPLPQKASFFTRKEDLLFDTGKTIHRDADHILLDNIDRLPIDLLREQLCGNKEAADALEKVGQVQDDDSRNKAFDALRESVEKDARLKTRLINRLDGAIGLARKRVECDYKTAIPAYYPTRQTMVHLLPLDLDEDGIDDVALVCELVDSGTYIGQTILTMEMAYSDARLICRPDSGWFRAGAGSQLLGK